LPPPTRQHFWGKIWHRGNFRPNVVIYETGCGNFPWKNLVTLFWPVNCIFLHKKTRTRCTAFCYWSLFCGFVLFSSKNREHFTLFIIPTVRRLSEFSPKTAPFHAFTSVVHVFVFV
jgi:hypothetical protein